MNRRRLVFFVKFSDFYNLLTKNHRHPSNQQIHRCQWFWRSKVKTWKHLWILEAFHCNRLYHLWNLSLHKVCCWSDQRLGHLNELYKIETSNDSEVYSELHGFTSTKTHLNLHYKLNYSCGLWHRRSTTYRIVQKSIHNPKMASLLTECSVEYLLDRH